MMSKTLAFFALLSATLAASSVIRAPVSLPLSPSVSKGPSSDSVFPPPTIIFTTCVNENLNDCTDWSPFVLRRATPAATPASCLDLDQIINTGIDLTNDISSVAVGNARFGCTLYTNTDCSGRSLFLNFDNGTINALSAFNFDNVANSFNCLELF
ncbi:hypothetical protein C8F04DRAFT_1094463 [Mycena alexandri]|uniref:Cyanovirin-N domain-containing protein n=1 Tax=Mycena alexandri TaxID=1745969 RepID=A0AAD6T2Q7_9AGAR|nr:hypothetical protein C8F04DRAFT_1094463 [Mycena alexandri]